jgi:hypothetical protein
VKFLSELDTKNTLWFPKCLPRPQILFSFGENRIAAFLQVAEGDWRNFTGFKGAAIFRPAGLYAF